MKRNRNAARGFSAVEALITIGILSFLLLGSASFFSHVSGSIQKQQYATARVRLIHSLINIMSMPATLRASGTAVPSSVLGKCIKHFQNALCSGWALGPPTGVALFLPPIAGTTSVNLSGPLSGPPHAPLRFSAEGKLCDPAKMSCPAKLFPISVSTRAIPICPPAYSAASNPDWSQPVFPAGLVTESDCWESLYIKIFYEFRPTPGAPEELLFAPVTGTLMVSSVMAGISI